MLQTTCSDSRTHLVGAQSNPQPRPTSSSGLDGGGSDRPLSVDSCSPSRGYSGNEAPRPRDPTANSLPLALPRTESDLSVQSEQETVATAYRDEGTQSPSAKHCLKSALKRSDQQAQSAACLWWPAGTDLAHKRGYGKPPGGCSASACPDFPHKRVKLLLSWSTREYLKPKCLSNVRSIPFP